MNLLERVLTLLGANLNAMIEKADDPEKMLRQLQVDMRNQLMQVKTQVATAIAEGHKLQRHSKEKTAEADTWLIKAEQAIQQGNDEAARMALSHYNDIMKQAKRYQELQQEQEHLVVTMRGALRQLEAKISEVETTIELLVTRKRNALVQQHFYEALQKTGGIKEKEQAMKAQDALLEAEARARALAELHQRDLETQLNNLSREQSLQEQVQDLKNRQEKRGPRLLREGNPMRSPLIPPQPQATSPVKQQAELPPSQQEPAASAHNKEIDIEQLKKLLGLTNESEGR
jgi:phage shock protein A